MPSPAGYPGRGNCRRPTVDRLQIADRAIENQLADALEVRIGVALRAVLRRELGALAQVIGAHRAHLFDA